MNERISVDPCVCYGQACIRGTRIPGHLIVRMLDNGDAVDDLLEKFPALTHEDIRAYLDYGALLAEGYVTSSASPPESPAAR